MVNQPTDELEASLVGMIEQARDCARALWKASDAFDSVSNDEAFDIGFEAAMDFALSDEFGRSVSRLKSWLDESGWSSP